MPDDSPSGFHRMLTEKKKGLMSHAASGGTSAVAVLLIVQQLWGGDIERAKTAQVDSAVAKQTVEAVRSDMQWLKDAMMKQMQAQGIQPPPEPKKVDTVKVPPVFIYYRGILPDTIPHVRGETVYVPIYIRDSQ